MQRSDLLRAFRKDCNDLIKSFASHKQAYFKHFCNEWKRMNFQYIFFGYASDHDMIQFLEDALTIIKHEFLMDKNIYERIGSLYLMYAIYFKQPTKEYCKYRFTLDEWQSMITFYNDIPKYVQARLIFWKLLQADAIQFVEAEYEYGFEIFMHNDQSKAIAANKTSFNKITPIIEGITNNLENTKTGLLPALNLLQNNYNELKKTINDSNSLTDNKQQSSTGTFSSTQIVDDIVESMKKIKDNFRINEHDEQCNQIMDELGENDDGDNSDNGSDYARSNILNIGSKRIKLKKKSFRGGKSDDDDNNDDATQKQVHKTSPYRTTIEDTGKSLHIHRPKQHSYEQKGGASVMYQLTVSEEGRKELDYQPSTSKSPSKSTKTSAAQKSSAKNNDNNDDLSSSCSSSSKTTKKTNDLPSLL